jgi:endonuclease/exonuclease/phosphatase family metal-dependent hydrolase
VTLRLATWNLWWRFGPWEARHGAIGRTLADLDADVVCLQETWVEPAGIRQVDLLGDELGLHAAVADAGVADRPGVANAILSRWPVVDVTTVPLPGTGGRPSPRHAVVAVLDAPVGRLTVVSAHLHHLLSGSATRVAQAAALAAVVGPRRGDVERDYPVLVGADLNAVPWSDEVRSLTGATALAADGVALTDCWEHAGGDGRGATWSAANPYLSDSAIPERRIDYLLVSWPRPRPLGNPVRCWLAGLDPVDGVQPSDHFAVVADLVTEA